MHFKEFKVKVNGISLAFRTCGKGEPLVLIHGVTTCGLEAWKHQIEPFSVHFELIIPDLRGHGDTDDNIGKIDDLLILDDLLCLLDRIGIKKAFFCGHSLGAAVLYRLAIKCPDIIEKMIAASGCHVISLPKMIDMEMKHWDIERLKKEAKKWIQHLKKIHKHTHWEEMIHRLRSYLLSYKPLSPEDFSKISVPVLVVEGEDDMYFKNRSYRLDYDYIKIVHETIPNCCLSVIPNAGHSVQLDNPKIFNQVALDFLLSA